MMSIKKRTWIVMSFIVVTLVAGPSASWASTVMGYWKFDQFNVTGNHNAPADNFAVVDSSGNENQMHTWQSDGYDYTSSTDLPSSDLFSGDNLNSWEPNFAGSNAGGVGFHETNWAGNDFNFAGEDFTLEGYFKTSNSTNRQDVIFNAQNQFAYLVNVNEGGAGVLRFATGGSPYPQVNLGGGAGHNYANDQWHYFIARYDEGGAAGGADLLSLATYDNNGLIESGTAVSPVGFNVNSTTNNLGLGTSFFANPFRGTVDEIRISRGLVDPQWQLNQVDISVDSFDNTHDYLANGTTGTIFDGLLNGSNATVISTNNGPTIVDDGDLTITVPSTVNVGWDASHNNAPFLYEEVGGGLDFDAQLVIDSTTDTSYSVAGLMIRMADPLADGIAGSNNQEDFLTLTYDNFGGFHRMRRRSLDDGTQRDNLLTADGTQHGFLRITREDDLFSLYTRPNDLDEWILQETLSRPDLTGNVQVGSWYGLFGSGNTGTAQFENFMLISQGMATNPVPEPSSVLLMSFGMLGMIFLVRRRK